MSQKNVRHFIIYFVSLFLFTSLQLQAQNDVTRTIQAGFTQYSNTALQEKIYVHTDKNFYIAGELLWFKIYCVEGYSHQPVTISKVAYVDILDATNKPVLQVKIDMQKGEGNGSLFLPVSLNSSNYRLRSYTNWMKNFGAATFFEKTVPIFNSLKSTTAYIPDTASLNHIDFFPEGGNMVKDIQSKIAFQLTDENGKGMDGTGIIVNEKNDTVLHFQPLKFGMGSFLFTPSANHTYRAIINLPDNKFFIKELPSAYDKGYVMKVNAANAQNIEVTVNSNSAASEDIYLIVHNQHMVKAAAKAALQNGSTTFTIAKNNLAEGINQLTVFNNQKQPICERLYFVRPAAHLLIEAQSNAAQYATRKKVTISVLTKNASGQPVPAHLSMAIYPSDSLQTANSMDIVNYLWLTSDLKGHIESPEYYFSNAATDEAIDNLMLTHGWRKFNWENILSNDKTTFAYIPELDGHIITGKVTDIHTGLPAKDIQTFLSIPGTTSKLFTSKSDDSGRVKYNVQDYYGGGEIIVQTDTQKDSSYRIEIFSPFSEAYAITPLPPFQLSKNQQTALPNYSVDMQVQNIYAKDSLAKFTVPALDTIPFYGHANYTYKLDDYVRFTTMEEVLREYVREINVRKREGKMQLMIIDEARRDFFKSNSLVILDGVPVFDQSKLFAYDPLKVRKLEVVPRTYYLGYFSFEGIAAFTTYKGELEDYPLDPRAIVLDYDGLQLQREFYAPVYETEKQLTSRLPDFRNVLYWSPEVNTDRSTKHISFYTSDRKGKYIVVLQGITEDGKAASSSFVFEVK